MIRIDKELAKLEDACALSKAAHEHFGKPMSEFALGSSEGQKDEIDELICWLLQGNE